MIRSISDAFVFIVNVLLSVYVSCLISGILQSCQISPLKIVGYARAYPTNLLLRNS